MTTFLKKAAAAMMLLAMTSVFSCQKIENSGNNTNNPPATPVEEPKSPEECKEYIQKTCIEAVEMIDASDFQPVVESVYELVNSLQKGVTPDRTLADWMDKVTATIGGSKYVTTENLTQVLMKETLTLAPFVGHVTIKADGNASYEEAPDFWVKAYAGTNEYKLTLTKSIQLCEFTIIENNNWISQSGSYTRIEDGFVKVSLPEDINLLIEKNGGKLANVKMHIAVRTKNDAPIQANGNLNIDAIIGAKALISTEIEMAGYKISLDELKLENQDVAISMGISKNFINIIDIKANVDDVDIVQNNGLSPVVNKAEISVDILKKLQVKGNAYVTQLASYIEQMYENEKDEAKFKSSLEKANNCIDLGIYFASDVKQAGFEFSPNYREQAGYWTMDEVLVFKDGSSSSYMLDEYFNSTSFANLIAKVQALVRDFEALVPAEK